MGGSTGGLVRITGRTERRVEVRAADNSRRRDAATSAGGLSGHSCDRQLFQRAVQKAYPPAMVNLGRLEIVGRRNGRDDILGYALVKVAMELGVTSTLEDEAQKVLDMATARMLPNDLATANRAARRQLSANSGQN